MIPKEDAEKWGSDFGQHPVETKLYKMTEWMKEISAVFNNIPFIATLIPLIMAMGKSGIDITPLWWTISLGTCLSSNGTLIEASANVLLSTISTKHGFPITFKSYMKVGFPVMILTIFISTIYLLLRFSV